MKTLSPAGRHTTKRCYHLLQATAALVAVAFGLFALTAHAQLDEAQALKSRNPYIRRIVRQYRDLNYEAALAQLPNAHKHSGNTDQERLWLELMEGILHHGLKQIDKAEAAFMRAFERAPDASLPISAPSQTLEQRFEALKKTYIQSRSMKAPGSPADLTDSPGRLSKVVLLARLRGLEALASSWANGPLPGSLSDALRMLNDQLLEADSPQELQDISSKIDAWYKVLRTNNLKGVNELTAMPVPSQAGAPALALYVPVPGIPPPPRVTCEGPSRGALCPALLQERIRRMTEWLIRKSEEGTTPQISKLFIQLNEVRTGLKAAATSHERMGVAITLDQFEGQLSIITGWRFRRIQGVNELTAKPVPSRAGAPAPALHIPVPGTPPPPPPRVTCRGPSRSSLCPARLNERIRLMKEWLIRRSEEGTTPQISKLLSHLNEIRTRLEAADSFHERMGVAIALDRFEGQLSIITG